jgi:deoxycytidine triphosphate deaminase
MARILSDREIKTLLGTVIQGSNETLLNPNGLELRLGRKVRFISTGEEKEIQDGCFVKVAPGETAIIASLERIDLSKATIQKHFPRCMLTAFVTPTTTMMREGIMQAATKIDAGYQGNLNWGFRNNSFKDFKMQQGEPIFKLTFFLLQGDEVPEVAYGEKADDKYQNTDGIMSSTRRLPVDIPEEKVVSASFDKLDPKKQLREAGHPFTYIGSELIQLQGKFELVSSDVRALTGKIESETKSLVGKIDETKGALLDKVDSVFQTKFLWAVTLFAGVVTFLFGVLGFIQKTSLTSGAIHLLAVIIGVMIPTVVWLVFFKKKA